MTTPTGTAGVLTVALSQIGVPYTWGGESPGTDFDCSGLVQWAYSQIGVALPRTSQAQYQATTRISESQAQPGDLVFSAGSDGTASAPGHVGIYLGGGKYLDAPYTGAKVRIDSIPTGATFGRVAGVTQNASSASPGVLSQISGAVDGVANYATGGVLGDLTGTATSTAGFLSDADSVLQKVTSVSFWDRIGVGVLGTVIFVVGLVVYFASTDTGQKAISDGTRAAEVAAVA